MNDRLPHDVLNEIFDYYAEEETVHYPLETLLLVCKSWSEAALHHRLLWTRPKIIIDHGLSSRLWIARLPRRLERAGEYTPLEINVGLSIELFFACGVCTRCNAEKPSSHCYMTEILLQILTGTDGELCKRWKSLTLHYINDPHILDYLSYPTPILTTLRYEQVSTKRRGLKPLLPSHPSLYKLHIIGGNHLPLPKLDSIRELVLDSGYHSSPLPAPPGFSDLHTATNLERLTIKVNPTDRTGEYCFPDRLPNLEFLSFEGIGMPTNITTFQAPNLQCLSLTSDDPSICRLIVDSSLPFSTLRELRLTWTLRALILTWFDLPSYRLKEFLAPTEDLLVRCTGLTRIGGSPASLATIVRLLWRKTGEMGSYVEKMAGKTITITCQSTYMNKQFTLDGPDTEENLMALVCSLGLVRPDADRETFLQWLDEQLM